MPNVFEDQKKFMQAGGQTVDKFNVAQYEMYLNLIEEEHTELKTALSENNKLGQLDAFLDMIVVIVGAMHSLGCDAEGGWNEVIRSNMSKVDLTTGKLIKRADGKILKPDTYSPPNLKPFLYN